MTSNAGTISPPGYRVLFRSPPEASSTILTNSSEVPNSGGSDGPKDDVMVQLIFGFSWAMAGAAKVAVPATAPRPAFFKNERRCMIRGLLADIRLIQKDRKSV